MEPIEVLNARLIEYFGVADDGKAMWRIVWSEDQFEMRETEYTDSGMRLIRPEVRLLPKYRQWIHNKWILERLVVVPECNLNELTTKVSYEVLHVFDDGNGNALPVIWPACKFVIDNVLAATGKELMGPKYIDPENTPEMARDFKETKLKEIEDYLFGNETNVGDALAHNQAVIVPRNFEKSDK